MKLSNILVLTAFLTGSCHHKDPVGDSLHAEKGIILSCTRCSCMEKLLSAYVEKYGFATEPIYTDTNCLERESILRGSIQFSQSKLDSLYKENYNIILFKKKQGKIEYRVINTPEVLSFKKIKKDFFGD